jgi:Putative metal-binding motif
VTSASHTFQYLPTDLIGGATDASLQLARYNSGWTYPSTVTGSNVITGASLNNTTSFGEFFAANCSTFLVSVNPTAATICNGQSVTLNASTNFGIPSYAWTGAGLNVNTGNSVIASPTSSITYTVVATTAQNCTSSAQVSIQVNLRPTGVLSGSTDICVGSSTTLSIAFTGTAPWSGTLSNGMTFNTSSNLYNFNVTPGSTTSFTITTLTDANCTSLSADMSGTATVTVHNLPNATISGPASACLQSNATFVVTGTPNTVVTYAVNGGANQYVLLNGGGLGSINRVISAATTIQLIEIEGDYCTIPLTSTWTTNPITLTANISGNASICAGSSSAVQFSGTANAVVIFTINGGSNQTVLLDGSGTASVNSGALYSNTVYQLVGVQSGSCFYTLSGAVTISVTELPDATFVGGSQVCGGSTQNIQVLGTANALVSYTINGGSAQNLLLNGSGSGSISTAPLFVNTSYELVSVSLGSCSANVGVFANFTITGNTYYQDLDGDGFGNGSVSQISCTSPIGYVVVNGDCDDSNPALNPNTDWYADMDGDGYGSFIYATQCANPGVAGVVSLGGDCDDNNPAINSSGSEVCGNGIDDNCNGQIDEGCVIVTNDSILFATNVQAYVSAYPFCNNFSGTTAGATNSPESNLFISKDKWYKFQATSSACRISLNSNGWDGALQMCDQNFAPIANSAENAVFGSGNEVCVRSGLTIGNWYYISVGGASISDFGNFSICIQQFVYSGCGTATAQPLNMCSTFKLRATNATTYTTTFTPVVSGMGGGTYTGTGSFSLALGALNLVPGQQYNVQVSCTYGGLLNGANQALPEVVMTAGGSSCLVSLVPHLDIQVRASQRCDAPATLLTYSYLRTDPFVCGVTNYTYEFTPTSGCSDYSGIGTSFQYNHIARNFPLNFNGSTTSPVGNTIHSQSYYIVRVRPNFGAVGVNAGSWGTPRIIFIGGTLMAESDETPAVIEQTTDVNMAIYPNPGSGESLNMELFGMEGDVTLLLLDQFGRLVETKKLNASEEMVYQWMFDAPLANGLYHIRASNQDLTIDKKYLVTR